LDSILELEDLKSTLNNKIIELSKSTETIQILNEKLKESQQEYVNLKQEKIEISELIRIVDDKYSGVLHELQIQGNK